MPRMFRVMGFWTLIFAVMFYVGDMPNCALLFLGQTVIFAALGYLNLTERTYIYLFGAYMTLFFVGFTYWAEFMMAAPGSAGGP